MTLREQIAQYVQHKPKCQKWDNHGINWAVLNESRPCDCGLDTLLASLDPRQDETWTVSADDVLTQHYKKQQEPE